MTNREYLSTLSDEEWYQKVDWLFHKYGMWFTQTPTAIIEWLKQDYKENKE